MFAGPLEDRFEGTGRDIYQNGLITGTLVEESEPLSDLSDPQPDDRVTIGVVSRGPLEEAGANIPFLERLTSAGEGLKNQELKDLLDLQARAEWGALQDYGKRFPDFAGKHLAGLPVLLRGGLGLGCVRHRCSRGVWLRHCTERRCDSTVPLPITH